MSPDQAVPAQLAWRISSTCESGACVTVAAQGDFVFIGNSDQPGGPVNKYTRAEWREFLAGAKLGEFDDLG